MANAKKSLLLLLILSFVISCKKDVDVITDDDVYNLIIPDGWPAPVYNFENNNITKDGFELGRKLFYDPILSRDNTIACGNCHQQFAGFAHLDHAVSHGINDLNGKRNAPSLSNLIWMPDLMWDGGVHHIELQPVAAITNPVEMDETVANVVSKLQAHSSYPSMFNKAFGADAIDSQLMLRAITQFTGMLVSYQSKYDDYIAGNATYSQQELNGLNLFRQNCASCHTEPLFTNFNFINNGLDQTFADSGRAVITNDVNDLGKFKVPSLRNVEKSYPYMHDGRFKNLTEVLNHYATGIKQSPTLHTSLQNGITLSTTQQQEIISFLQTLTDNKFIKDKRFAEVQ
ncbi:MAG: cytochrome-c peroxidase [Bacteroidetes bacterium]|nr:cytochrome-c peroxidase [Bacteroidota bacterium]